MNRAMTNLKHHRATSLNMSSPAYAGDPDSAVLQRLGGSDKPAMATQ
jgi:hypothetical protein